MILRSRYLVVAVLALGALAAFLGRRLLYPATYSNGTTLSGVLLTVQRSFAPDLT
jgi:hypothetical protein